MCVHVYVSPYLQNVTKADNREEEWEGAVKEGPLKK